ncbi:transporter substrate-binding domain-containing protein [Blautia schinkii]|nr:transporter substrate-binding domain-containing protein [Blautia schinkii]
MKKRVCVVIAVLLAVLLLLCTVQAYPQNQSGNQVIRIGYFDTQGFLYQNPDGSYSGYAAEFLENVSQITGWEYEFICSSWDELREMLDAGEVDFLAPVQADKKRRQEMEFGRYTVGYEYSLLYVRDDKNGIYYDDYEQLNGLKIGVVKGWQQQKILRNQAQNKGIAYEEKEFSTEAELAWALRSGQIDAAMFSSENYSEEFKLVGRWGANPAYFVTSLDKAELMEQMNDAVMQALVRDPQLQNRLYEKYYTFSMKKAWPEFTREEAEYIREAEDISVALIVDRFAWGTEGDDGQIEGIIPDIFERLGEISGLKFSYLPMKTGDAPIEHLDGDEVVLAGEVLRSKKFEERNDRILTVNYAQGSFAAVGQKGFDKALTDTLTVAVPQKFYAMANIIQQNHPQFTLVGYSSIDKCLRAVINGEADMALEDSYVVEQRLQKPEFQSLQVVPGFAEAEEFCMAGVRGRDETLISILNKSIAMLEQGFIENSIIRHTVGRPYSLNTEDFLYAYRVPLLIGLAAFLLCALFLILLFNQQKNHNQVLRQKNQELERTLALAEQAGKAKDEFLSRMSHEMRTPLNAIIGFSKLCDDNRSDSGMVHDYHQKIGVASNLLLHIINDILDMSAIERNKIKLESVPVDLGELLEQMDTVYQDQCGAKGIKYERHGCMEPNVRVLGDSLRISQIFLNLLSNAVKFTDAGGRITVDVEEKLLDEQNLLLKACIRDNGIGMSEDMLDRVFQPFEQENGSVARRYGGSGLGLSIVKGLVETMGGSIHVESGKCHGTAFYVEIPFLYVKTVEKPHTVAAVENTQILCGKRVLLAEDNEMNAEIAGEFVKTLGGESDWAKNGREAVELFRQSKPGTYALILMDIQMPETDGYTATRIIRGLNHPQAGEIPIIAMTADAFLKDKEKATAAGMNAHIAKPIDIRVLREEIGKWV